MHTDERAATEANRLYWESETPIAEIAERLDLSRRALYDAVEPVGTGDVCPRCGGELQFNNRSARKAGYAVCAACGAEEMIDPEVRAENGQLAVVRGEGQDERRDMREPDLRHRAVVLGGAAIAGVALGSMAAWLATRRD